MMFCDTVLDTVRHDVSTMTLGKKETSGFRLMVSCFFALQQFS